MTAKKYGDESGTPPAVKTYSYISPRISSWGNPSTIMEACPIPAALETLSSGRVLAANPALLDLLGYSPSAFENVPSESPILWCSPQARADIIEDARPARVPLVRKAHMRCANGSSIPCRVTARVIEEQDTAQLFFFLEDIRKDQETRQKTDMSESNLLALIENTSDTIMRFDHEHRHLYVSPGVERETGIKPELFIGKTHRELGFPEHLCSLWENAINEVFDSGDVNRIEFMLPSGIWIDWLLAPETDDQGRVVTVITSARDISDRKRMEEALKESEQHLSDIIEFLPDATLVIDKKGKITAWNKAMEHMTGYSAVEMIGKGDYEYAIPFYGERRPILVDLVLIPKEDVEEKYYHIKRDGDLLIGETNVSVVRGENRFLSGWAHPIYDTSGQIIGSIECIRDITDKRRTEESLALSESKYRFIADNAHDVIWTYDLDAGFTYMSPSVKLLRGFSPDEAIKQSLDQTLTPESYDFAMRILEEELLFEKNGQRHGSDWSRTFELEQIRKDGSTVWTEVTVNIIYHEEGGIRGIIGITRDITERKKAEYELLESKNYLNEIINSVADPIFVKDRQHRWVLINDAFCSFMGHNREKLIGKSDYDFLPKEESDIFWEKDEVVFKSGEENINEETITDSRAIVHTIITKKTLYSNVKGEQFIVGIIRDITIRKRAEENLQKSNQALQAIIDASPLAIFTLDHNLRVTSWSPAAERIFGWSKEEAVGQYNPIVPEEKWDEFKALVSEVLSGKGYSNSEVRRRTKDGRAIYVNVSTEPLRDAHGKVVGALGVIQDVTESKRIKEDTRRLESQLAQAQKMESIGTLAGGIAHDFNNILAAIIGYSELALDDVTDPEKLAAEIKEVIKAGDRAKHLVSQILTFSRKTETKYSPMELPALIKESLKMLRSVIPTTVDIRSDIIKSGLVMSDPTQIHQLIMNLCTNAAHSMDESGGILSISLQKAHIEGGDADSLGLSPGHYLRLSVSDTGHGMPPEIIERIYEPYFTTKELSRGTGLGLSVVHGIVKSHGGAIKCKSAPGKGTTFDIFLPELVLEKEAPKPSKEEPLPTGAERILYVDDEPALTGIAEKMLGKLGYDVTTLNSSLKALEVFRANPDTFDLVITDMTMPGMTGDKLAQNLMEIRPDIPVILCSGYSEHISSEKAESKGIREYLMKPLQQKVLAETIRKVLDTR